MLDGPLVLTRGPMFPLWPGGPSGPIGPSSPLRPIRPGMPGSPGSPLGKETSILFDTGRDKRDGQ